MTALQALAEAQRQHIADMRGELGDAKAERDRLLAVVERLAERPARRRWRWWRRGEGE